VNERDKSDCTLYAPAKGKKGKKGKRGKKGKKEKKGRRNALEHRQCVIALERLGDGACTLVAEFVPA
jgi:hypothetical protein